MSKMTTGSYSMGFNLANGYATRATVRVHETGIDSIRPAPYQSVTLRADATAPYLRRDVDEDFRPAATTGAAPASGENTTSIGLKSGTHVSTSRGVAAVDFLTAGDEVVTAGGTTSRVERIERRLAAHDGRGSVTIRIARGALGDQKPSKDLWLAPQQVLVVGGATLPAISLVNDVSIQPVHTNEPAVCFLVVLDKPAMMLAEDIPVGSFAVDGFELASAANRDLACRQVAARAGVAEIVPAPVRGPIRGYLEDCSPTRIAGWAQDSLQMDDPVEVTILVGDEVLTQVTADQWRSDLQAAQIGDGDHGFEYRPATPLSREKLRSIKVVCLANGSELQPVQGLVIP